MGYPACTAFAQFPASAHLPTRSVCKLRRLTQPCTLSCTGPRCFSPSTPPTAFRPPPIHGYFCSCAGQQRSHKMDGDGDVGGEAPRSTTAEMSAEARCVWLCARAQQQCPLQRCVADKTAPVAPRAGDPRSLGAHTHLIHPPQPPSRVCIPNLGRREFEIEQLRRDKKSLTHELEL